MAALTHAWDLFKLENRRLQFKASDCLTTDKQLVYFGQDVASSKSAKYSLKIFWMCDAKFSYVTDGIVRLGRHFLICESYLSAKKI